MATIHVCDRCKAATTNPTVVWLGERVDLCEGCLASRRSAAGCSRGSRATAWIH